MVGVLTGIGVPFSESDTRGLVVGIDQGAVDPGGAKRVQDFTHRRHLLVHVL